MKPTNSLGYSDDEIPTPKPASGKTTEYTIDHRPHRFLVGFWRALVLSHFPRRQLAGHPAWDSAAFFKTFREALLAYTFDIGGLLAGTLVATQLYVFQLSPWAIAVYPAIVSAKGVIGGLLSGRLSTALHLGTIYPRFLGNTKSFYKLFEATIVVTLVTSIAMSTVSVAFGNIFWGITFADFPDILIVIVATMGLGLTFTFVTMAVAFVTFEKGLDPDVMVYPIMSTTADIGITTCYVLILSSFSLFGQLGRYIVALIGSVPVVLTLFLLPRNIHDEEFVKTVKESLLTLMFVAFIVNVTGTVLKNISEVVQGRKEIYTAYPALIDMVGDVGSVIGSTATTKLALGLLEPSLKSIRNHAAQISSAWAASMIMFVIISALSLCINGIFNISAFLGFASLLLKTNVIAVTAIVLVSYLVSILTFKRGLDPDNFVIPIESSFADSVTSMALLVVLLSAGQFGA